MLGTKWVAPGEGATVESLASRIPYGTDAAEHLMVLRANGTLYRTNLALTGEPLTDYDLRRIAVCE